MADHAVSVDEQTQQLYLDLFTEIAIIEHLVRQRYEPRHLDALTTADFGVLNHFVRLGKASERLQTLAWCFQVELAVMRATVASLAKRRLVDLDWVDGLECVFVTDAGRDKHHELVKGMAPDVLEIMSEIDHAALLTTAETLREMRRTLDNLPDR